MGKVNGWATAFTNEFGLYFSLDLPFCFLVSLQTSVTKQENMAQEEEKQSDANSLGRYIPPWREPYIIAMAGSSGSGKTSIAQNIIKQLNVSNLELSSYHL